MCKLTAHITHPHSFTEIEDPELLELLKFSPYTLDLEGPLGRLMGFDTDPND